MITEAQVVWRCGIGAGEPISMSPGAFVFIATTHLGSAQDRSPREMLAAADAGSVTAALARSLQRAGRAGVELRTRAVGTHEREGAGSRISCSALTLRAKVPSLPRATYEALAWEAANSCANSKVLRAPIKLAATLLSGGCA